MGKPRTKLYLVGFFGEPAARRKILTCQLTRNCLVLYRSEPSFLGFRIAEEREPPSVSPP